jgi:hypothetical protein
MVNDFMRDKTISIRMGNASLMTIKSDPIQVAQAETAIVAEDN